MRAILRTNAIINDQEVSGIYVREADIPTPVNNILWGKRVFYFTKCTDDNPPIVYYDEQVPYEVF